MLTRCFRIIAIAALGFALPAMAHHVETPATVTGTVAGVASSAVLTGTVKQLIVEDRTTGTTTTYRTLRQDDGTAVELTGALAASLEPGARAQISGQQTGGTLAMTQVQSLAALPAVAPTTSSQVQGTLTLTHSDDFANGHGAFSFAVRPQDGGRPVPLVLDVMPDTLKSGMQVLASGTVTTGDVSLDASYIAIIAQPTPKALATVNQNVLAQTTNNVLFLLVKFANSPASDPFTQSAVDNVTRLNSNSVANYYKEVSYNQEQMNVTVTPWLTMAIAIPPGADATHTAQQACDNAWPNIGTYADTAATNAGYNIANYQNVFYVFPNLSYCGWAGLAYVSYGRAWSNGYNQLSVYAHELGHNFGLLHAGSLNCGSVTLPPGAAGCGASEYGDPFVVMGNQSAGHFNALQKTLIDAPSGPWIAATGIKTHTSGTASYTLGPIESAGMPVYAVKIPTTASNRTYWLEYRQPVGSFDASILSAANSGLHVRVASPFEVSSGADDTEIIDMTPGSASAFSNAALLPGLSYVDNQYNVTISVLSATPGAAGTMTVQVTTPGSGASTTTAVTSSLNPSTIGANVTFTATITGSSPTGTVGFTNNGVSIAGCTAQVVSAAKATCATSALTAGGHSIAATYSGDGTNAGSTSPTLTQTVNKSASSTAVSSSQNPSSFGSSVTLTATITGNAPSGSVGFTNNGVSIAGCTAQAVSAAKATCATSALTVGGHSIVATYSGDTNNAGSTSPTLTQTVNKVATSTTLAASPNPSTSGASVTFTATVSVGAATGSVGFTNGGSAIAGCTTQTVSAGKATCITSALTVGGHSIVATYGGDSNNNGSTSPTFTQTVNKAATSTTLAATPNPSTSGASVAFTATLSAGTATGSVGFTSDGGAISGCTAQTVSAGKATCTTAALSVGGHSIVATYNGDANNTGSTSPTFTQTVNSGSAPAALVNASFEVPALLSKYQYAPTGPGVGWTFNATAGVQHNGSSWGAPPAPNGTQTAFIQMGGTISQTVTLNAGSYTLAFQAAQRACCAAPNVQPVRVSVDGVQIGSLVTPPSTSFSAFSIPFSVATTGAHTVTFAGTDASADMSTFIDAVSLTSSSSKPATSTALTSSANPSAPGASVTFTATITGSAPTGTVGFTDNGSAIAICTAQSVSAAKATCTIATLSTGSHSIVATYSGDANNAGSASPALVQGVGKAASATTLASSPNPSTLGASVTFTATVTGSAPTGTVGFTSGGSAIAGCTAQAVSSGKATCGTAALTVGGHSIVATYSGDANNTGSTSPTLTQTVNSGSAPAALVNASFEVPALASGKKYQYAPGGAGVGWTFNATAGIQHNGSSWGALSAPNGTQTAFIQMAGTISQTVTLNAGSYTLAFQAAQRACCAAPNVQPIRVSVDGVQIGSLVTPPSTGFSAFSIPFSVAATGAHTITFAGTDASADMSTLIDAVSVF